MPEYVEGEPYIVNGIWLINRTHTVDEKYLVEGPGTDGLQAEASKYYEKMRAAAAKQGHYIYISMGYRSFEEQTEIYARNVRALGKNQKAAAPPGASEHSAGLAADICSQEGCGNNFGASESGKWVAKNAWKYGFILRYPKTKTEITGYQYEPWHFRYIGREHTAAFHEDPELTLEEYLGVE
ncbi:MAG: M15 family metallopeptidase [Propionibacteriaceae bacterium]|nr:M15 family metallopeptidase [Propionibacteriaceae bacterium]